MKKYLVKKAHIKQEEFYSLELDGELVERVKNRINNYEYYDDFNLSDKEMELIDENVLAYCFTDTANNELYNTLTDAQKELVDTNTYDLVGYIEEILDEFVWDVDCEYGDSEIDYTDNYIDTYENFYNFMKVLFIPTTEEIK